jgi:hypothetical protein
LKVLDPEPQSSGYQVTTDRLEIREMRHPLADRRGQSQTGHAPPVADHPDPDQFSGHQSHIETDKPPHEEARTRQQFLFSIGLCKQSANVIFGVTQDKGPHPYAGNDGTVKVTRQNPRYPDGNVRLDCRR